MWFQRSRAVVESREAPAAAAAAAAAAADLQQHVAAVHQEVGETARTQVRKSATFYDALLAHFDRICLRDCRPNQEAVFTRSKSGSGVG